MSSSSGNSGGIFDYIWLLLTPLTALWALLSSFMSGNTETQGATSGNQNTSRLLNTSNPSSSQSSSAGPSTSS